MACWLSKSVARGSRKPRPSAAFRPCLFGTDDVRTTLGSMLVAIVGLLKYRLDYLSWHSIAQPKPEPACNARQPGGAS